MKLRSVHRRNTIVSRKTSQFRVDNPRIAPRNGDNYVDPCVSVHQYACMPLAAITVQTAGEDRRAVEIEERDGERERERRGGGEIFERRWVYSYHVTNVGQFTNPIMANASDDVAVYGLLMAICIRTQESTSKVDVRLLRNFSCGRTRMQHRLNS